MSETPPKITPLPTLVLPHSPFVYQNMQNITNLTTLVTHSHQAKGWSDLSSGSHMVFTPQRSRNLVGTPANITPASPPSPFSEGWESPVAVRVSWHLPVLQLFFTSLTSMMTFLIASYKTVPSPQIQGMKYWLEVDEKWLLVPEKCLVISKEDFLSNPPQNLRIKTKIIQERQIGIHTHTPSSSYLYKMDNKGEK